VGTNAISLTGTANGVVTATGPVVNTAGSFTASAWVNLASLSGYQTFVSIAGNTVAGFFLQLRGDTGKFAFTRLSSDANGAATFVSAPTAPVAGTWYHIVGVDDATAGTLTLYVDGQSVGSTTYTSGWTANGNTLIGHGFYNGSQVDFVNGSIDDVEMFSSALSADQVAALDEPAAYPFDDGMGTTAADYSGHGNTLTLGSGATWAAGHIGSNSLAVNGTASGNATSASPVLNTALPFSVSAWVNLSSVSGYQTFASIDGSATSAFYLQLRGDTGKFAFTRLASDSTAATAYHADATSVPTIGTWYNLVGVNDVATGQLLLYVNGVLQSSVSYTGGWQGTGATVVGGGKFNGGRADFVNGQIDDVRFYDAPLSAGVIAAIGGVSSPSTINVATGSSGATVSPNLFGAFMEDINYGGEGGLYNDEIRNSGFNDSTNALNSWAVVKDTGVNATLTSDATTGPTTALTQSGMLAVTSGVSPTARVGISNSGYFGLALAPSTTYSVQFYAKASSGFTGALNVTLESTGGTIYANATIPSITTSWAKYTATFTTSASTPVGTSNQFVISTKSTAVNGRSLWFGAAYLFPPSYQGAANHLRTDLMQKLAALHPAIFRVPGGNYLEGNTYADRFQWSNTIGPIENRPGHYNSAWGYWSTDGMGLDEYLQMAEEVGAAPILAVYAGYTLNGSSDSGQTLTNDVTDAVNELHYVLDPTSTSWGAMRAANGHPAAYNVNYVEIGNEDGFSSTYPTRYPLFYNAIHSAFPSLKIIATSSATSGSPFDVLDEHFYQSPAWFEANSNYFDNVARGSYKVFIGEYASNEGSPTNDMNSALGDASWLMGLERNSDLVTMSSYAPLWANVNGIQWNPDLIGFNGTTSYGSPSYYAQLMLSQNHGTTVVSSNVSAPSGLQTLVTKTGSTYYLTVVNTLGTASPTTINLAGATSVSSTASVTSLSASSSTSTNSIASPTNIVPVTSTATGLAPSFSYTFPGNSITVLQFTATFDTPSVATPAAANPSSVNGTTTNLSVLGSEPAGDSNLKYTWSATGPAAVNFSANGTNAAKNTTATFAQAGTYNFNVTIADSMSGASTTSSVLVTVNQIASGNSAVPINAIVAAGATTQFMAGTVDQFGSLMSPSAVTWSVASGGGSISSSGVYLAPATGGSATVRATFSGGATSDATATIVAPIAWYRADESSGTTLADSSGNGHDATLTGAAAFAGGVSGNALSLSGGNANLPAGIVSGLNDFTISAWVRPTSLANWARVFDFGTGTTANMFLTDDAGGTNALRFAITTGGGGGEQRLDGPALTANTWTHVAVTLSGNIGTLYVNGLPVATNTGMTIHPTALGSTTQNYLGKSQYAADPAFQGSIDDFRLYGTALTAQQILQLADPVVTVAAAASSNPVTTTSATLSVAASDVTAGESGLTYTWSLLGTPPAPANFSVNGTNAAKNTVTTFTQPGTYSFQVAIVNPAAGSAFASTSSVNVTVNSTLTNVTVSPASVNLHDSGAQQFTATGYDQFGAGLSPQPTFTWSATGGSVSSGGLYTAPFAAGDFQVSATSGTISGTALAHVTLLKGDVDGDGHVNIADNAALMSALGDLSLYVAAHQFTSNDLAAVADIDGSNTVNNLDVMALLVLMANGIGSGSSSVLTSSSGAGVLNSDVVAVLQMSGQVVAPQIRSATTMSQPSIELARHSGKVMPIDDVGRQLVMSMAEPNVDISSPMPAGRRSTVSPTTAYDLAPAVSSANDRIAGKPLHSRHLGTRLGGRIDVQLLDTLFAIEGW
jgi:alpha-L-arabinofuranosidase